MGLIDKLKKKIFLSQAEPVVKDLVDAMGRDSEKVGVKMKEETKEKLIKVVLLPAAAAGVDALFVAMKDGFQAVDVTVALRAAFYFAIGVLVHSPREGSPTKL